MRAALLILMLSPWYLVAVETSDWPSWRGPLASGVGPGSGAQLVDDLNQATLVWRSEQRNIPSNCWTNLSQGGYDSPIVADGKVFLAYNQGAGDLLIKNEEYTQEGRKWFKRMAAVDDRTRNEVMAIAANDTVLCVDATTGKTKWKTVLAEGINLFSRRKEGPHNGACWHDHKVYAQSSLGVVYCLDDETGAIVWQAETPATAGLTAILESYKRTGYRHPYRGMGHESLKDVPKIRLLMSPLQVSGGVVVADGGGRLVALDIETGKQRWQGGGAGRAAPLPWSNAGKDFVIAGSQCLDAATGEVVWEVKDAKGIPTLGDDHVIYSHAQKPGGIMCFRISATGAEHAWTVGGDQGLTGACGTSAVMNGYVWIAVGRGAPASGGENNRNKFFAVELATGEIVGPIANKAMCLCQSSSVVAMDGRLFGQGWGDSGDKKGQGTMYMINADPKDMRFMGELGAFDYAQSLTPAVAAGFLYIRGADSLYCYDLRK